MWVCHAEAKVSRGMDQSFEGRSAQTSKEVVLLQRGSNPVRVLLQTFMGYIDHCVSPLLE